MAQKTYSMLLISQHSLCVIPKVIWVDKTLIKLQLLSVRSVLLNIPLLINFCLFCLCIYDRRLYTNAYLLYFIVYSPGDLVWGKSGGHPWWPGMICNDPHGNTYIHKEDASEKYHVQFFSVPSSHAWIHIK